MTDPIPFFCPPMTPSVGLTRKPKVNVLKVEFGDGYSQRVANGINHIKQVVKLKWDVLSKDECDEIEDFLRERGGYKPFYYELPYAVRTSTLDEEHYAETGEVVRREKVDTLTDTAIKFVCDDWQVSQPIQFYYSLEATFEQVYTSHA